ncbi:Beta-glucosidase [Quillaja saponaria]|uniref:Beta-glucosidase n=1 Tax=Quillaja saponaria TaxID=32244 RepID=A0AAD7VND8_QUISA|nr:Beta-glucosidase [Quillaja saponaria]
MTQKSYNILNGLVLVLCMVTVVKANSGLSSFLNRSSFPPGFIFGTASSAYQYEGAASKGGRGSSIWDTYTHKYPEKIADRSNGDVAVDHYNRYKEDVAIMKNMNWDAYRFSISWSRILPKGKLDGGINREGIEYYNNLINDLIANDLQPFVTLFHWDVPQALEDEYGGFLSPNIVNDFRDFAELCFKEFGDRVMKWITLNEPWSFSMGGYAGNGRPQAPGCCSDWQSLNCTGGDSRTEPYLVSHHQLLAHSAAVKLYKANYQTLQRGFIGITLTSHWFEPLTNDILDRDAQGRALDFMFGWFMEPLTKGDYPYSMRYLVGNRLPKFSKEESELLKQSFDFIGLNYYTANYVSHAPYLRNSSQLGIQTDSLAKLSTQRNGMEIGPRFGSNWLYVYPRGFRNLLLYTKRKYNNPILYITENGVAEKNDPSLSLEEALMDTYRIDYYYRHLYYLLSAIKNGANVKGYFAWSLLDNFEWSSGYDERFGINFVDYKHGLKRHAKLSSYWFTNFLRRHELVSDI